MSQSQHNISMGDFNETIDMENRAEESVNKTHKRQIFMDSSDDEDENNVDVQMATPQKTGRRGVQEDESGDEMAIPRAVKRRSNEMVREDETSSRKKNRWQDSLEAEDDSNFENYAAQLTDFVVPKKMVKGMKMSKASGILVSAVFYPEGSVPRLSCAKFIGSLYTAGDRSGDAANPMVVQSLGEPAEKLKYFKPGDGIMIERADFWGEDIMIVRETRVARAPKLAKVTPLLNDPTTPLPLDRVHTYKEVMYHPSAFIVKWCSSQEKEGRDGGSSYKDVILRTVDYLEITVRAWGRTRLRLKAKEGQIVKLERLHQEGHWPGHRYKFRLNFNNSSEITILDKTKIKGPDTQSIECTTFEEMRDGIFYDIKTVVYGDSSVSQGNTEFAALDYSANMATGKGCCGTVVIISGRHFFKDGDLILLRRFVFQKQQYGARHQMAGEIENVDRVGNDVNLMEEFSENGVKFI